MFMYEGWSLQRTDTQVGYFHQKRSKLEDPTNFPPHEFKPFDSVPGIYN